MYNINTPVLYYNNVCMHTLSDLLKGYTLINDRFITSRLVRRISFLQSWEHACVFFNKKQHLCFEY